MKTLTLLALCVPVLAVLPSAMADHAAPEVLIGRDAAGRLSVRAGFVMPHRLPSSVFSAFPGFAEGFPGFESLDFDVPADGHFTLLPGAQIEVLTVSVDAGLRVTNETGSGFLAAGDTYFFGPPFFDFHPLWQVQSGFHGQVFAATFIARDRSGTHTDSMPFTLTFTPVVCQGDFNGDGKINTPDLVYFLGRFGSPPQPGEPWNSGDFDDSGTIDTPDLVTFLGRFGKRCT